VKNFFEALWPGLNYAGNLTFWFAPSKKSAHFALPTIAGFDASDLAELKAYNASGQNIYFGAGLRARGLGAHEQGTRDQIVAIPGLLLDLDFAHPTAHATKKPLIPGADEAFAILATGPTPTMVVFTGHGWHVYWLFKTPWILKTKEDREKAEAVSKKFQQHYIAEAEKQGGWHVDSTATIQRVWRVPGFKNCKTGAEIETIHHDENFRYEPKELVPSLAAPATPSPPATPNPGKSLDVVRASLEKLNADSKNKKEIEKVLAGESFADEERDTAMQSVCSTIAWIPESAGIPAKDLVEILRPSLSVWAAETDNPKRQSLDAEMAKAFDKIQRAQQDKLDHDVKEWEDLKGLREALGKDDSDALPENELVINHTMIQFRDSYYIFNFERNRYSKLKTKSEIIQYAREAWKNAPGGIALEYVNAKGEIKQKTVPRILFEYCHNADDVIGEFCREDSEYDLSAQTFYESIAPVRKLEPTYNDQIAHWLKLLAGPNLGKVLDWIAAVTQLERQCCVLYLDGASGAGKGLLGAGLSRLWHAGGATPLADVIGNFNADMFRCPLLFLDEGLPKKRGEDYSTKLRALIGSSSFSYREKFLPNRTVLGSVRLLIAANNDNVLAFGDENLSVNDLEAYIGRFLHVRAHQEAATWLEAHNAGNEMTKSWVDGDLLAKHALWLRENRTITPGKRFLVEGDSMDNMHRKLVMQGEDAGLIFEWLVRFASNPQALYGVYRVKKQPALALVGNNQVLINTEAVLTVWDVYMGDQKRPSTTKVGATLRKLSEGYRKIGSRGSQVRYHVIKTDLVTGWASDNQVGDEVAIRRNLNTELEEEENDLEIA
jgi:hypothetical protein